jgi:hypothetical protein
MKLCGRTRQLGTCALALAGLLAASLAVSAQNPAAAQVARSCVLSGGFNGYGVSTNTGRVGAGAYITVRSAGPYCTSTITSSNQNAQWSMVASADNSGWAQSGYLSRRLVDGCNPCGTPTDPVHFAQTAHFGGGIGNTWTYYGGAATLNTNVLYYSIADWNCGCTRMFVGYGVEVLNSINRFNPYTDWSGTATYYSYEGGDIQNYAFGTTFSRVGHTGLVELPYLGSWTNSLPATATLYDNSGYWNQTAYTTCLDGYKCFDTWSS